MARVISISTCSMNWPRFDAPIKASGMRFSDENLCNGAATGSLR
jgi:hypothetical protein